MTTVYCSDHFGYGRTKHGRLGECGCHVCRATRVQKVINRKRMIREMHGLTALEARELAAEITIIAPATMRFLRNR